MDIKDIKEAIKEFIYKENKYSDNDCPFCGHKLPHSVPGDTICYLMDETVTEIATEIHKRLPQRNNSL